MLNKANAKIISNNIGYSINHNYISALMHYSISSSITVFILYKQPLLLAIILIISDFSTVKKKKKWLKPKAYKVELCDRYDKKI